MKRLLHVIARGSDRLCLETRRIQIRRRLAAVFDDIAFRHRFWKAVWRSVNDAFMRYETFEGIERSVDSSG
jgi:hypothetical protein